MIRVVGGTVFLMQRGDCLRHEIDVHNVNLIRRTKWQRREASEEYECLYHIELSSLRITAIAQDDARPKNCFRRLWQQDSHHVLAEFFRARIRIIIRALPVNRTVLADYFVLPLAGNCDCAHLAEALEPVIVLGVPRESQDFERAPQIYIQAALLGPSVQ